MALRLFVALRPPAVIRERLLALCNGVPGARWQVDDQLHLTLRFVGEIDPRQADDLAAALAQINAAAPAVRLAGTGQFDHRGSADALWAGVAPHDALTALHRKVDAACVRAGLPPDRRAYLPHITVARLSRGCRHRPGDRPLAGRYRRLGERALCPAPPHPLRKPSRP